MSSINSVKIYKYSILVKKRKKFKILKMAKKSGSKPPFIYTTTFIVCFASSNRSNCRYDQTFNM